MARKNKETIQYGEELGVGIRKSLQGLNTMASPKKRKTAILLIVIPLILYIVLFSIGMAKGIDGLTYAGIVFAFCLGLHQFYVGKIGTGILYTITCGVFLIGAIISLFKLCVTKTFRDANGFPLIY